MAKPLLTNFVAQKTKTRLSGFAELSTVALTHAIEVDGRVLHKGTLGTVVGAYSDGIGYEVEFAEPFHAVVTLEVSDLTA